MIYLPVTLLLFLLFLLLLPFLWFVIAVDIVEIALTKLGFSPDIAFWLLAAVVVGSLINIPLYTRYTEVTVVADFSDLWLRQLWGIPLQRLQQKTVVALNVGGGVIPVILSLYVLARSNILHILIVTSLVTIISYFSAQVVPGIGIKMNALIGPLTAAFGAILVAGTAAAPVAFASGILGVLVGADLLHLGELKKMPPGIFSIGGAGVFDGIVLCGLLALLLS